MKKSLLYLFFLVNIKCFGQSLFYGKIIDSTSLQPIIGASISDIESGKGTISNENGEFNLSFDKKQIKLLVSHISYKKKTLIATPENFLTLPLSLNSITLKEAIVGNPANTILNLVVKKAMENVSDQYFFDGFFQKTSMYNGKYTKIHEMFFEASWRTDGIYSWIPNNVRYAQEDFQKHTFKNFIFSAFLQTSIFKKFPMFPLNSIDITENHKYKIENYLNEGTDDEIVIINCSPKNQKNEKMYFSGEFLVNTKNLVLLEVRGSYHYPKSKGWRREREVTISFKLLNNNSVFNYLFLKEIDTNLFTLKKRIEKCWIYSTGDLKNLSSSKTYKRDEVKDDLEFLKTGPYQKEFWDKNIPIQHTKLEKEIIKYFNKKGSFEGNIK